MLSVLLGADKPESHDALPDSTARGQLNVQQLDFVWDVNPHWPLLLPDQIRT